MFGLRQSRFTDAAVRTASRILLCIVAGSTWLTVRSAEFLAPSITEVVGPVFLGIPARSDTIMTPREAQRAHGYDVPAAVHRDLRRRQAQRVFGAGAAPDDEGLVESEVLIGTRSAEAG